MSFLFGIIFLSFARHSLAGELVYISTLKAKLLKEPTAQSQIIVEIQRGESVEVKKTDGSWIEVTYKNKTGWLSKLFTSKTAPLKNSDVTNLKQLDSDKVGRVRLNYENKGAARGLTDGGPKISRNGFSDNQKVYEGLQSIENQSLSKDEIQKFQIEGNLKP